MSGRLYRPIDPWGIYADAEVAPTPPTTTDPIPALRGLFALARGNYATVSAEDLQAAVDAGYVHPDVLACVVDEIAYATEAADGRDAKILAEGKAYVDGLDAGIRHMKDTYERMVVIATDDLDLAKLRKARAEAWLAELKLGKAVMEPDEAEGAEA